MIALLLRASFLLILGEILLGGLTTEARAISAVHPNSDNVLDSSKIARLDTAEECGHGNEGSTRESTTASHRTIPPREVLLSLLFSGKFLKKKIQGYCFRHLSPASGTVCLSVCLFVSLFLCLLFWTRLGLILTHQNLITY